MYCKSNSKFNHGLKFKSKFKVGSRCKSKVSSWFRVKLNSKSNKSKFTKAKIISSKPIKSKPRYNYKIIKHYPIKKILKETRKCDDKIVLNRLIFIKSCYDGRSIKEATVEVGVSENTGRRWLKRWNEEGLVALVHRKKSGRPPKLSKLDKLFLKCIMLETEYLTTEKLHRIILYVFNVDYCFKQVREIAHDLGFSYSKPYPLYNRTPYNAKFRLKESTKGINLNNSILGFLDQTCVQNLPNCTRILQETGAKNRDMRNAKKYKLNIVGFMAVNGESYVKCVDNSQKVSMIQYLGDLRIKNIEDEKLGLTIKNLLYNDNLKEENIKELLREDKITEKELQLKIDNRLKKKNKTVKQTVHGIELDLKKIKISKKEIKEKTEKQIIKNLEESGIKEKLKEEKEIIIVLDNYPTHKSEEFKKACAILNINPIYLPPYSPHLNPIEQLWRKIKREISAIYIENKEQLEKIFKKEFYKEVIKETYFKKWMETYITNNNQIFNNKFNIRLIEIRIRDIIKHILRLKIRYELVKKLKFKI